MLYLRVISTFRNGFIVAKLRTCDVSREQTLAKISEYTDTRISEKKQQHFFLFLGIVENILTKKTHTQKKRQASSILYCITWLVSCVSFQTSVAHLISFLSMTIISVSLKAQDPVYQRVVSLINFIA